MKIFCVRPKPPEKMISTHSHPRRRADALPRLRRKLQANLASAFEAEQVGRIVSWFDDGEALADMTVSEFMDVLVVPG